MGINDASSISRVFLLKTNNLSVNDDEIKQFTHVISTIPLPVLRTIDLSAAGLQSNALRELNYGPSIKVGIQFKAWWFTKFQIIGGQSYTDRLIRTIVYPSFGDVQDEKTTTLIASYCWTEDASRMGALIDVKDGNGRLKELVLIPKLVNSSTHRSL